MKLVLAALLVIPLFTPATATAEPVLRQRTSWLGETLTPEDAAYTDGSTWPGKRRWVQTRVKSVFVDPQSAEGRVYTNSVYDESGREAGVYQQDGALLRPVTRLYRQGDGGTVVSGDDKYFYADFTQHKDGIDTQVLVRFQRGDGPHPNPYTDGTIPMSDFPGGDPVASGWTAGRKLSGKPGGLATGLGFVFVTRPEENAIYVYERERMTLVTKYSTVNPTAVAFRHSTSTLFVLQNKVVQEYQVQYTGAMTKGAAITDTGTDPVAIAVNDTKLYIADNGPQQVRIYANRVLVDKLGQAGGLVGANGFYGDDRFDNLTGVGVDAQGNVFVAANGRGTYGWTDIRLFSPQKTLRAKVVNYIFMDTVVPDPRNPGDVYSAFHHYKLDYNTTTPGAEWAPERTRLTVNRATCPQDPRTPMPGSGKTFQTQSVALRYLKGADGVERKYLFARPLGNTFYNLGIYRFDGDNVRPSVLFSEGVNPWPDGTPSTPGVRQKWVDTNANCKVDAGEITEMEGNVQYISYAQSIDDHGDIWGGGLNPKYVHHFPLVGFDAANNPKYGNGQLTELTDAPVDRILQVQYDRATDTLYLYGALGPQASPTASPKYILARYDSFSTPQRKLTWSVDMGYTRCWADNYKQDFCIPYGLAIAGNRVYVADQATPAGVPQGRVRTYNTTNGVYRGSLYAGPEVSKAAGFVDIAVTGITATRLPSGEHVVFREEDALGRVLMYRYTPET
ncbi:hypothetical protein Lesp02_12450 [Lentzea sp. NBRC 105346]|uniref:hypothetical protein n=1 Tax=Lentzea sp. NBRC 105346 TaxID=3032205 RepID=UPI0024A58A4E|nr:hypothetical protein [Lentzea sp. NBRC 105346]GLZ29055.1 hypothetical protein Lesp02_12450 [Lentzea sp. NBRC 105346]